ncbi:MAG: helix-turn-helix domain-containing protein [Candidatus Aquilonibacter sp.]
MNHVGESHRSRFGDLLREFRRAAGLSQEALAERARISVEGVGALERGISQAPQRETLALLVRALNLNPEQQRAIEESAQRPSHPRSLRGPRSNLPSSMTPLFGRAREIEEIAEMLDRFALITLTGAGGVGKTRLAMQVGVDFAARFADGVWFVDLSPLRDPKLVPNAVASVLSVTQSPKRPLADSVIDAIRNKRILLIIDNCEHLLDAASFIEAVARAGRHVRVVATSRQSLSVVGEKAYRVASLAVLAAIELFADCARRATETFDLTSENGEIVARICRQLDGIPLAIELAAARMGALSLQELEERLSQRFRLLTGSSSRCALPRHQTMRALIDWSYDLLSDEEKVLFARLAVFAPSFSLEAAGAVCHDDAIDAWHVLELLASLVEKSLVLSEMEHASHRYRLLESIRLYAAERSRSDEEACLRRLHAEYYTGLAERAEERFATVSSTMRWAAELEPDIENIRGAMDWSLKDRNDIELGVRLLAGMGNFWLTRGLTAEGAQRAEDGVAVATLLPTALQAALWLTLSRMRGDLFSPSQAEVAATRACELYEKLGDELRLVRALRSRGAASMRLGRLDAAEVDLLRALELSRKVGAQREITRALATVGVFLQVSGRLAEARDMLMQAFATAQDSGDDRLQWLIALNLAECEFALGDIAAAIVHASDNLAREFLRVNVQLRSNQEANLAAYLVAAQREAEARRLALEAVRDARERGDHGMVAIALGHAAATLACEDAARAARLLGYVDHVLEVTGFTREYPERFTRDLLMQRLHESFDDAQIAAFVDLGTHMTEDQALRLAQRKVANA